MNVLKMFSFCFMVFNLIIFNTAIYAEEIQFSGKIVEFTCEQQSNNLGCQSIQHAMNQVKQKSILAFSGDRLIAKKYEDMALLQVKNLANPNKKIITVDYF